TLKALAEMLAAAGVSHPSELGPHHLVRRTSTTEIKLFSQLHRFLEPGSLLEKGVDGEFYASAWKLASAESFDAIRA
ncbi:MAG TPA: FMN-binding glutamate synthase family protein, partial [Bosea sp. (in: a-proteobacteria)]|nr:FMN-binding glutamate synthase family protein [Bosea sp. (in: a-proteobacteria)]